MFQPLDYMQDDPCLHCLAKGSISMKSGTTSTLFITVSRRPIRGPGQVSRDP